MRVFISWSGNTSRSIAERLRAWLPEVIQQIDPWCSTEDIDAGARWGADIAHELAACRQGIIVVTAANWERPWLNFEAGALAKTLDDSRVRPLLWDIDPEDMSGPLTQFQMLKLRKRDDMLRLTKSLNANCDRPVPDPVTEKTFARAWGDWDEALADIGDSKTPGPRPQRQQREMLGEILETVRAIQRNITRLPGADSPSDSQTEASDEAVDLTTGNVVEHPKYGRGVIVRFRQGSPVVKWFATQKPMHMVRTASQLQRVGADEPPG